MKSLMNSSNNAPQRHISVKFAFLILHLTTIVEFPLKRDKRNKRGGILPQRYVCDMLRSNDGLVVFLDVKNHVYAWKGYFGFEFMSVECS
jgi:hypothetical protein